MKQPPKLRYLNIVQVAVAQTVVCLAGLYGLAKEDACPLHSGGVAVESRGQEPRRPHLRLPPPQAREEGSRCHTTQPAPWAEVPVTGELLKRVDDHEMLDETPQRVTLTANWTGCGRRGRLCKHQSVILNLQYTSPIRRLKPRTIMGLATWHQLMQC